MPQNIRVESKVFPGIFHNVTIDLRCRERINWEKFERELATSNKKSQSRSKTTDLRDPRKKQQ